VAVGGAVAIAVAVETPVAMAVCFALSVAGAVAVGRAQMDPGFMGSAVVAGVAAIPDIPKVETAGPE
jgi:hypothetical protein